MSPRGFSSLRSLTAMSAAVLALALTGCTSTSSPAPQPGSRAADNRVTSPTSPAPSALQAASSAAKLTANVLPGATQVTVDTPVTVRVKDGTLNEVVVTMRSHSTELPGRFNAGHTRWTATVLLEPGTQYVVSSQATDAEGTPARKRIAFRTESLTLPEQTYAAITPLQDEVVGVGMPVIVHFDVPVTDRARFERHMRVTASPATKGSWSWLSGTEAHWRPQTYWQPGTKVQVEIEVNGLNAGNGIYGQMNRSVDFTIGRSVVMRANVKTDTMQVLLGGRVARTIPITGGKPGFLTRSGTKLIVEKFKTKRMDAATVGIRPGDPEYYNIPDVRYAQRVTYTGEFLHAAPWSVYAQGSTNVSHGCVGMSTKNARWLFHLTHRGDPVEVTGTRRSLEPGNGWTDWNESFADFKQGSAL